MPPELSRQLVFELDAWYRSHKVRQKDLATELELSPQQLSEILSMRNRPTADQILNIQTFLLKEIPMSIRTSTVRTRRTANDEDEPLNFLTDEPDTLCEAREMVDALRAELQLRSQAPASAGIVIPPADAPTTSVGDPRANAPADPGAHAPRTIQPKPAVQIPTAAQAENPETMSIAELRCGLQNEKDPNQQSIYYQELKRREPLTVSGRSSTVPAGTTPVPTVEIEQLQRVVEKSRSITQHSLTTKAAMPAVRSPAFIVRPETPLTAIDQLRVELTAEKDSAKRTALYKRIKGMENDAKLSNPQARLRGA
jgi:transcriptional regulator with XRE-family HTH domain